MQLPTWHATLNQMRSRACVPLCMILITMAYRSPEINKVVCAWEDDPIGDGKSLDSYGVLQRHIPEATCVDVRGAIDHLESLEWCNDVVKACGRAL